MISMVEMRRHRLEGEPMKLIALTGPIGSGKSEIAKFLLWDHGYHRYSFAGRLKRMLMAFGLSEEQVNGDLKEVPCEELCGKTPRYAMQTLGTEWRDMLGSNLWVGNWERDVRTCTRVVVDDLRFPHEVEAVKRLGGTIVRVYRPGVDYNGNHASEVYRAPHDYELHNNGDLVLLRRETAIMEESCGEQNRSV